ncbi:MAG: ABC transporter permease [Defluviitaleaceae bacterium]|nr:ABC transporter permease [Defluviitaleaceae bacterium]
MKKLFAYPYVAWMAIFIIAPLLLVLYYSVTSVTADGDIVFTLDHFRMFFDGLLPGQPFFQRLYVRVAMHSVQMAVYTTIICLLLGYPLAYILASKGFSEKSFLIFMFIAPMWMNFLVRTYAWLTILERNGLINTMLQRMGLPIIDILFTDAAVLLGMVYNFLPFMVLPIYTSLTRMDTRILEAAEDLGASPPNVFARVVLPLSVPGIVSGITMVFMPSVATFIIPNLLGGGQYFMLGNLIEQQFLRVGNRHFGSAVAVILVMMMFISMAVLSFADKRADRRNEAEGGGSE